MQDAPSEVAAPARAEFLGRGSEYFRIWIVNVALTLVTLGIYSAWAKVRREQYFHRSTRLAGAAFDYDARPIAILRGRILAVGLLAGFQIGTQFEPRLGLLGFAFLVALPWLVTAALRFRLHHTLHRGLRFGFRGRLGEAFRSYVLWPLAGAATLGALLPVGMQRQLEFVYGRSGFGGTPFASRIPVRAVYAAYLGALAVFLIVGALAGAAIWRAQAFRSGAALEPTPALSVALAVAVFVLGVLAAGSYLRVRIQNLAWNHLRLGPHRFRSDQTVLSFLALQLGNLLGMAITLGLFRPWAAVRNARYRAAHTELLPGESLDAFVAGAAAGETAAADEIAELFGFDVGF